MTDAALDACVAELTSINRRLPTLDEIIAASGGCQRARAVAARKRQAQRLTNDVLSDHLVIPEHMHQRHLVLMREWLRIAHESVEPWVQEVVDAGLETQSQLEGRVSAQASLIAELQRGLDQQRSEMDTLRAQLDRARGDLRQSELAAVRWQAIAETKGTSN